MSLDLWLIPFHRKSLPDDAMALTVLDVQPSAGLFDDIKELPVGGGVPKYFDTPVGRSYGGYRTFCDTQYDNYGAPLVWVRADILATLADVSQVTTAAHVWVHSGATIPFEPHLELDGAEFISWDDDVLAADPSEWPYVTHFRPSDHSTCGCAAADVLVVAP